MAMVSPSSVPHSGGNSFGLTIEEHGVRVRKYLYLAAASWIAVLTFTLHQVSLPSSYTPELAAHANAAVTLSNSSIPPSSSAQTSSLEFVRSLFGFLLSSPTSATAHKDLEAEVNPLYFVFSQQTPDSITQQSAFNNNPQRVTLALDKGDTLLKILMDADVPVKEAQTAIDALRTVYDPRQLKEGQEIAVVFGGQANDEFMGLELNPSQVSSVSVSRNSEGSFQALETNKPIEHKLVAAQATIFSSLFEAGSDAGIPTSIMSELLKIYAYNVDFQRDIHSGDSFRVIFERDFTSDGKPVREGHIIYASLNLSGKEMPLYRFEMADGTVDMFDQNGSSIRKALMRTPIDGAHMTSGFGVRHHPILGYSKMHAGVDFGAAIGTPIYAAGDGVIEEVGGKGSYGNYIRIKHTSLISSAYAHMSRFAKNIHRGIRVAQGEIIGYVGTTGRSTGPHLHYEVIRSGRPVNPLSVDMPSGKTLDKKMLPIFEARVQEINILFASLDPGQLHFANLRTDGGIASSPSCTASHTC